MMDLEQFLLCKIAEEANEVGHRAMKQQQYGRDEVQPGQPWSNGERLGAEVWDMAAVASLLVSLGAMPHATPEALEQLRVAKVAKMRRYLELSISLGRVAPEALANFDALP